MLYRLAPNIQHALGTADGVIQEVRRVLADEICGGPDLRVDTGGIPHFF
jgi:hypothetical protein